MKLISLLMAAALALAGCTGSDGNSDEEPTPDPTTSEETEEPTAATGEPILVGLVLSLSGPAAEFGVPEHQAIETLVERLNAEGGIDGRPIELLVHDDQTDPTESARGAQRLIEQGAVAIIGATIGSGTLALAPIAAANKVPVLAPNATASLTNPSTEYFSWLFRIIISDQDVLPALFERVVADGHKRVAIFYQEDAYGEFGTDLMRELAGEHDQVEIVEAVSAALDATDVTAQATRLRESRPDAVSLNLSSVGLAAAFLRAASDVGLDAPIYAGLGVGQPVLLRVAGEAAEGRLTVPNVVDDSNPTPEQTELFDLMEEAGYEVVGGFAAPAGAAGIQMLVTALQELGPDATGEEIRDFLESGHEFESFMQVPMVYSPEDHDPFGAEGLVFTEVRDGRYVGVE